MRSFCATHSRHLWGWPRLQRVLHQHLHQLLALRSADALSAPVRPRDTAWPLGSLEDVSWEHGNPRCMPVPALGNFVLFKPVQVSVIEARGLRPVWGQGSALWSAFFPCSWAPSRLALNTSAPRLHLPSSTHATTAGRPSMHWDLSPLALMHLTTCVTASCVAFSPHPPRAPAAQPSFDISKRVQTDL